MIPSIVELYANVGAKKNVGFHNEEDVRKVNSGGKVRVNATVGSV